MDEQSGNALNSLHTYERHALPASCGGRGGLGLMVSEAKQIPCTSHDLCGELVKSDTPKYVNCIVYNVRLQAYTNLRRCEKLTI